MWPDRPWPSVRRGVRRAGVTVDLPGLVKLGAPGPAPIGLSEPKRWESRRGGLTSGSLPLPVRAACVSRRRLACGDRSGPSARCPRRALRESASTSLRRTPFLSERCAPWSDLDLSTLGARRSTMDRERDFCLCRFCAGRSSTLRLRAGDLPGLCICDCFSGCACRHSSRDSRNSLSGDFEVV